MNLPDFEEEKALWGKGYDLVIGVDEVGRGCFAGPIVASAVAFSSSHPDRVLMQSGRVEGSHSSDSVEGDSSTSLRFARNDNILIDDSKRLKPQERRRSAQWIKKHCLCYGIGEVGVATINKVGIGKATAMAMRKAVGQLLHSYLVKTVDHITMQPFSYSNNCFVLVDAFHIKYLHDIGPANQKAIKKGDQKSISIAAASIVAKVYRDTLMQQLSRKYTIYGWGRNKGYGTKFHQEAIKQNGITKLHRIIFIKTFLRSQGETLRG